MKKKKKETFYIFFVGLLCFCFILFCYLDWRGDLRSYVLFWSIGIPSSPDLHKFISTYLCITDRDGFLLNNIEIKRMDTQKLYVRKSLHAGRLSTISWGQAFALCNKIIVSQLSRHWSQQLGFNGTNKQHVSLCKYISLSLSFLLYPSMMTVCTMLDLEK